MYEITEVQRKKLDRVSVNCWIPGKDEGVTLNKILPLGSLIEQVFKVLNEEEKND